MSTPDVALDLSRVLPTVDPRRVLGVDVARALALLGMMATHILPGRIVFEVPWAQQVAGGRASALFAVLAGVSVALVSGRQEPLHGRERYAVSLRLTVRALLIGALGLLLGLLPSGIAVILTFYAVLFLLGLPFLGLRAGALATLAAAWAITMPVVTQLLRPLLPPHQPGSPNPGSLVHPAQLASELLVTGYYPALVWLTYLLAGMAIGRAPLQRRGLAVGLLGGGVVLALATSLVSRALLSVDGARAALGATYPEQQAVDPRALDALLVHGLHGTTPTGSWWWLATAAPHSGTPFDLLQTTGSAMAVLGACLLLARVQPRVWAVVFGAGAMTLSLYTLHVLVMARGHWPDLESSDHYGDQVLLVLGVGAFFALAPLRGPLEWLVARASARVAARITGSPREPGSAAYVRVLPLPHPLCTPHRTSGVTPARATPSGWSFMPSAPRAVIGSGIAGLTAAHVLSGHGPVTLYEADQRLGGHADTHRVNVGGRTLDVDTGFIVHNERTYPTLMRLFAELGVATQESDMSMSVRCDDIGLEYAGAKGVRGLFPRPANLASPGYLRMLGEVRRFHREARVVLAMQDAADGHDETLRAFVRRVGLSDYFTTYFMQPLVGAVWSCDPDLALDFPARYLFEFLDHHGMLTVFGSPTWRTVVGGSARYVERVASHVHEVRLGAAVCRVAESADGVLVEDSLGGVARYESVIIATHPHQALGMLERPTDVQQRVLGAITYSQNVAQLHTDDSVLPRTAGARASWNYWRRPSVDGRGAGVLVTYDLTRLQRLEVSTPRMLVTLNGTNVVDPALVVDTMHYEHPLYGPESVAAQRRLPEINTARVAFAGAYHGWGFHEDGARSGVAAAAHLGAPWLPRHLVPPPPAPAVARGTDREPQGSAREGVLR